MHRVLYDSDRVENRVTSARASIITWDQAQREERHIIKVTCKDSFYRSGERSDLGI